MTTLTPESYKKMPKCPICGRPFKKAWDDYIGRISDYLFEPDCKHYPEGIKISIG